MDTDIRQADVCGYDELSEDVRKMLDASPEHVCSANGNIYLVFRETVFILPDTPAGNELVYTVTHGGKGNRFRPGNAQELFDRVLNDPDYIPDPSLMKQYMIRQPRKRCVAVLHSFSPLDRDLYSYVISMAPLETGDLITASDFQTAVLIKDLENQSADDIKEFIEAVIGTMEAEGITDIRAGIGHAYTEITDLRSSYSEGKQALDLGMRYHPNDQVFVYDEQLLERIVDTIPEEKKKELQRMILSRTAGNRMSDDMLETVRVFFQNDLNLTAASKQLFIHRNTLNYRLDKIKKDFNLDLRVFEDAVIFRIISELSDGM